MNMQNNKNSFEFKKRILKSISIILKCWSSYFPIDGLNTTQGSKRVVNGYVAICGESHVIYVYIFGMYEYIHNTHTHTHKLKQYQASIPMVMIMIELRR